MVDASCKTCMLGDAKMPSAFPSLLPAPSPPLKPQASSRWMEEELPASSARAWAKLCSRPLRNWWRPYRMPACASASSRSARMRLPQGPSPRLPPGDMEPEASTSPARHSSTPATSAFSARRRPLAPASACAAASMEAMALRIWGLTLPAALPSSGPLSTRASSSFACCSSRSLVAGLVATATATSMQSIAFCSSGSFTVNELKSSVATFGLLPSASASCRLSPLTIWSSCEVIAVVSIHSASLSAENSLSGRSKCFTASRPSS
mmetsp:Transcript_16137/g.41011  ORF Transcript_16137/g.41011 Transcript_16137/m.41011 type:complete len:264 (-) Transcript_16137:829-1620(-)